MRAKEFVVEYKTEEYNGLRFTTDIKNGQLIVRALDDWGTNELGHVVFNIGDQDELDPQDLEVDDRYQGQGIAKTMYDYVRTLGYEIHRSWDQTPAGAGFWNKHRGEERVWEDAGNIENFNGIQLSLEIEKDDEYVDDEDTDNQTVYVKATANGKELGHVLFTFDYDAQGQYLYPQDLEVEERFRGQGIAQTMYDYVKSKGYRIKRSGQQTDAGTGFWAKHRPEQNVWEDVPQPGPSSGAPRHFGADAKIQTRPMTVKQIISSVPDVPYYNNVVDDWDAKDYSWGVTNKVIEYATYLKDHPESLAKLPPIIVLNGKFEDGAHRVSAIWLLQQRMDPKNPLWSNAKLNVQFVQQGS